MRQARPGQVLVGNRVRTYSRALSGASFTVPGPLLTKKSPSGADSRPFHFRYTAPGCADGRLFAAVKIAVFIIIEIM